jgi:hypothetical protein
MALAIPIITEFDGKGISKAITQFKNLETNGEKAHFAIQKAALPAAAALAGLTAALGLAVTAAAKDEAAQEALAGQLKRTTGATDDQIESVEDWIKVQGRLLGYSDDQLRPAMERLTRATGDISEAQALAGQAMDIASAKHVDLSTAVNAVERAYGGNLTALKKLAPELGPMIKDGADLETVMEKLAGVFGGAAADAADTAAGRFARMKIALDETKESIGAALLPAIEAVLPYLQSFSQWAQDNPGAFLAIAGAIGAISAAIVTYTAAAKIATVVNGLFATSFTALQIASGLVVFTAIVGGLVILWNKFEWFRDGIKGVVNDLAGFFENMGNAFVDATNVIIYGINLVKPGKDIQKMDYISIPRVGGTGLGDGGNGMAGLVPPVLGGSVGGGAAGGGGGGGILGGSVGSGDLSMGFGGGGININVEAGIISSPGELGSIMVEAIQEYQRQSGVVFAPAA